MLINEWLKTNERDLAGAGISTARLDCLVLLEDLLQLDRARILAHPETVLSESQITKLNKKITQRKEHIPLAYIRGKAAFFGREFTINQHVLVPRPESEAMIEILGHIDQNEASLIADVGTGSGCLGITAALELPHSKVLLYDIEPMALQVAHKNTESLHVKNVQFMQQDLLPNNQHFDTILANLPYVPKGYPINSEASHEPAIALFAGKDGLDLYQRLWQQIGTQKSATNHIVIEALQPQHIPLINIAETQDYTIHCVRGLALHFTPHQA